MEKINNWYYYRLYNDNCKIENIDFIKNIVKFKYNEKVKSFCNCKTTFLEKFNSDITYRIDLMNNVKRQSSITEKFLEEEELINEILLKKIH